MYIRKTQKTVQGNTYTNYLLVESVATAKGPRQRTICSLGDLSPRPASEWLKLAHKVEQALAGQGDLLEAPDAEAEAIAAAKVRAAKRIRRDARLGPDVADLYNRLGVPRRILAPVKTWTRETRAHSD